MLPRNEVAVSFGQTSFETSGEGLAAGASYNRFWTRMASTRAGFFRAQKDHFNDGGQQAFTALYASAEIHPFRGRLVSPRLAAGAVHASSERDTGFGPAQTHSEITALAAIGVDFRLTPRFLLGAEFVHVPHTPNARDRFAERWDPQTTFVSARYRW